MPLSGKELIQIFDDFLLDIARCRWLCCNTEKGIEELFFRLLYFIERKEEVDKSPSIPDLILHRIFSWLVRQIFQKEVVESGCAQFQVENLLPHVSPYKRSSKRILYFQTILFEALKCVVVKTNFGVDMIVLIEDDSFHGSVIATQLAEIRRGHNVHRICIAENEVLNQVKIIALVVDTNVNLGFSEPVLTRWVYVIPWSRRLD